MDDQSKPDAFEVELQRELMEMGFRVRAAALRVVNAADMYDFELIEKKIEPSFHHLIFSLGAVKGMMESLMNAPPTFYTESKQASNFLELIIMIERTARACRIGDREDFRQVMTRLRKRVEEVIPY